jgi:putative ABC transport system ATP-binding protein
MNPTVSLQNVNRSFVIGTTVMPVLRDVHFEAWANEVMFLVGPSGCGKTTLLSILCGTLHADSGQIEVLGTRLDLARDPLLSRFRSRNVGFVFQQFNLIPTLDLSQNVAVPLLIQGTPRREALDRARAQLEAVGLGKFARERPNRLSGGQQQRVAIARALVHCPALLICDEPSSALDSRTGHQVMELLRPAKDASGRTVIVVTHDPRIYGYADRMAEMEDGRICRTLHSREAIAAAQLNFSAS